MKKGHEPYSELSTEHMFEKTEKEKLAAVLDEKIKSDPEHAAVYIAEKFENYLKGENKKAKKERKKAEECIREERRLTEEANRIAEAANREKQLLEKKDRKRKTRNILIFVWLVLVAVLTLVFEYVLPFWKIAITFLSFGTIAIEIVKILFESFVNSADPAANVSGAETYGMVENLRRFGYSLRKKGVLQFTALFLLLCITAKVLAYFEVCERIALFCKGGSMMLAEVRGSDSKETEERFSTQEEPESVNFNETRQYLAGTDEELIRLLNRTQVARSDLDMLLNLSQEDYEAILFLGETDAGEALSQELMDEIIFDRVNELLDTKLENEFDRSLEEGGPLQSIRNEISRMSDAEKEARDFSEIKEILTYRESINESYPKRTLTQLVSNGYHHLALLLYWNGGEEATITYYYGQSILYGLRCLEFADNTGMSVKEKLLFIAQRYEDITYTCPGFQDNLRAGMLATAFRHAADRF